MDKFTSSSYIPFGYFRQRFILYSLLILICVVLPLLALDNFTVPLRTSFILFLAIDAILFFCLCFLLYRVFIHYLFYQKKQHH